MKKQRNVVCDKIRAVKSWLSLAEDNFSQENDVRGELNLLLAKAEMQNLRAQEIPNQNKSRHIFAIFTAFMLVTVLFGGWMVYNNYINKITDKAEPNNYAAVINNMQPAKIVVPEVATAQKVAPEKIVPEEKVNVVVYEKQIQVTPQVETNQLEQEKFTDEEIRELVRTAGNTLRGK